MRHNNIPIYSKTDFENMRKAGSLAAHVLDTLFEKIIPGITTLEINDFCNAYCCRPIPPNKKNPVAKHR